MGWPLGRSATLKGLFMFMETEVWKWAFSMRSLGARQLTKYCTDVSVTDLMFPVNLITQLKEVLTPDK